MVIIKWQIIKQKLCNFGAEKCNIKILDDIIILVKEMK